ncbi:hypothetical protein QBC37DRAFT_455773 [Rhypophila decipiens]|uniref:Uncharacterized protein n=1 Tax=Rhypophila decipiens TaxID=261697 RepID=A0AAN6XVC7_9PEZI|nr:hypothetical protein QBC37DRAFT_455773 [Rhypophila decipiens]
MTTSPLVGVGLAGLTTEILHLIIIDALITPEYVEGEKGDPECLHDLQNLRLTSRLFNAIASEKMFPSITVGCRTSSVDRFCAVAAHPSFSRGVRVVKVSLDEYSKDLAKKSNFRGWVFMCVKRLSSMIESRSPLRNFYGACTSGISRAELEESVSILDSWKKVRDHLPKVDMTCEYVMALKKAHKIYWREAVQSCGRDAKLPRILAQAITRLPRSRSLHFVEKSMPDDRWTIYPNQPWKSYYQPMTDPVPSRCSGQTRDILASPGRQPHSYRLLHMLPIILQALRPDLRLEHMVARLALPAVMNRAQAEALTTALSCLKLKTFTFTVDSERSMTRFLRRCDLEGMFDQLINGYLAACLSPRISSLQEVDLGVVERHWSSMGRPISIHNVSHWDSCWSSDILDFLRAFNVAIKQHKEWMDIPEPLRQHKTHKMYLIINPERDDPARKEKKIDMSWRHSHEANHPGLPNLKRIRLHKVDIHETQLKRFLANTPATLDEFVLDHVKIAEVPDEELGRMRRVGSWAKTLDLIRQAKTFNIMAEPGRDGTRGFRLTHAQSTALGEAQEAECLNFGDMYDAFGSIYYDMEGSCVWSFADSDSNSLSKAEQYVNR